MVCAYQGERRVSRLKGLNSLTIRRGGSVGFARPCKIGFRLRVRSIWRNRVIMLTRNLLKNGQNIEKLASRRKAS
jgi:hypothetical protein